MIISHMLAQMVKLLVLCCPHMHTQKYQIKTLNFRHLRWQKLSKGLNVKNNTGQFLC